MFKKFPIWSWPLVVLMYVAAWLYVQLLDPPTWRLRRLAWRFRWRGWRRRCLGCGQPLEQETASVFRLRFPALCHRCGKQEAFARAYGMAESIGDRLTKEALQAAGFRPQERT